MKLLFFSIILSALSGCAYKFGYEQRDMPGGYKQVAIPIFKNKTQQVGIEPFFTNELIKQFNRSQVAEVVGPNKSLVTIEGEITSIVFNHGGQVDSESKDNKLNLPKGSVLTVEYRVLVESDLRIRRNSDQKIIWQGRFNSEKVYTAPQLGFEVVNSANALYNHSARMEVFELIARDMMAEAHDRMTENF